jgi:magnesium-transporting ATPase (P-type)
MDYLSTSPDEEALVKAARTLGYSLHERGKFHCVVNVFGESRDYQVTAVRAFSAANESSGVVVELENGTGILFVKGSLKAMKRRLKKEYHEDVFTQHKEISAK